MRLLLVEDDTGMAELLSRSLRRQGYSVDQTTSGRDALTRVDTAAYDAVVLETALPGPDGYEVCRQLREDGRDVPVVLLGGRDELEVRKRVRASGADDSLTKPFALGELHGILRALTRRDRGGKVPVLSVGDLVLDPATRAVHRDGKEISLSPKEYTLLSEFLRRPGEVLSRPYLIEHVWDFAYDGTSNVVDAYVKHLRNKIDRPFGRKTIRTVRAVGYLLDPDA